MRMINLGPHASFIVAAYSLAVVVLAALITWIALDYRSQQNILTDLDKRGVKRRSRKK
jgi:heme exporter protein D